MPSPVDQRRNLLRGLCGYTRVTILIHGHNHNVCVWGGRGGYDIHRGLYSLGVTAAMWPS